VRIDGHSVLLYLLSLSGVSANETGGIPRLFGLFLRNVQAAGAAAVSHIQSEA